MSILISIVTVAFNNRQGLERTYNSISDLLSSSNHDVEWVVIDGGSKDGSRDFLSSLDNSNGNVRYLSEPDRGIYDAMNKGVGLASGDFVWFLNAGDVFLGKELLSFLKQSCDVYFFSVAYCYGGVRYIRRPRDLSYAVYGMPANHQGTIYKRSMLVDFPYPLKFGLSQDYWLSANLFKNSVAYKVVDELICEFEVGGVSTLRFVEVCRNMADIQINVLGLSRVRVYSYFARRFVVMSINALLYFLFNKK